MSSNKVIAFGHSHLGALSAAYADFGARSDLPYELTPYQFLRSDREQLINTDARGWRYHDEIERDLIGLIDTLKPAAVVIMMHGEQAVSSGLIAPVKPYDFFFPGEVGYTPDPNSEIIPFDLIKKIYVDRYHLITDFINLMKGRLPPISFALCPPPPVGDRQYILDSDTRHGNISSHIEKFGLPSTDWRYRIWKINTMALEAIYAARNIGFIQPPSESFDDSGCLRTEYRADVFHANAAYGRLLLDQISHALNERALAPEPQLS